MSNNIRIKTTPNGEEKRVNLNINQKFDFIEILSLKISQEAVYRRFCSDYGVVVGRVIVNNGVGVPNVKVSVFVPIDEFDLEDQEISGLYPFQTISDVDSDNIPYNLLPRDGKGKDNCYTPVGTFPNKREVQDNPILGEIYCKYYKFTSTTNESGDFMIFGLPVGTHVLHVDADMSDIGYLSQRPYDLIREGSNEKSFKSTTKFKNRKESGELSQIETISPVNITIPPFWGDIEQCQIGIARSDINLNTYIVPSAIFMGSLVSDNDKHALSRTCRPRKKLGKMDELVTGDGRIEMIRKTPDGGTERFDVEGGQVIDENGVWAYQIPMNLDYMVTAEDGTLVPSGDPSIGIPTKARVRFRIGMTEEGDEGRFRTRAKYLVPHNPNNWSETDFSFDTTTTDRHFRDLSWNKIYTVKNHITRVQPNRNIENRNFIGFKNVDDSKDKNPIPFNKLDNDLNPLYRILCIYIRIISRIVVMINSTLIPIFNFVIYSLNTVLRGICFLLYNIVGSAVCGLRYPFKNQDEKRKRCKDAYCINEESPPGSCKCTEILPYIPYITLSCSADENGYVYAPGGRKGDNNIFYRKSYEATKTRKDTEGNEEVVTFHYVDEPGFEPGECTLIQRASIEGCDAGWSRCQAAALADALDVIKFDFYNDWINGTLYPFLLKYKVKRRGKGRERFCEVDCDEWPGEGVNNDNKNGSDNPCKRNYIVDSCAKAVPQGDGGTILLDFGVNGKETIRTRSGYIKKYENELYYSPITRVGENKLFATDIVNLGSIFEDDWEGKPRLYQYLLDTTFNIPPLVSEYEQDPSDNNSSIKEASGIISDNKYTNGLIGDLSCLRFNTNSDSCNNLKRLCELGVGLDERREVDGVIIETDDKITNVDVEADVVRGIFTYLNSPNLNTITGTFIDTNKNSYPDYQDSIYSEFRKKGGIKASSFGNKNVWIYDNSYYFYFGLNKGKTALSKLKKKYLAECTPEVNVDFFVIANNITPDTNASGAEGAIEIQVVGGIGPFEYLWSGPEINEVKYPINNTEKDVDGLYGGTYNVTIKDSAGNITNGTFIVPGPTAVNCSIDVLDVTTNNADDGEIIVNISDGVAPYTITLSKSDVTSAIITKPIDTKTEQSGFIFTKDTSDWDGKSGYYHIEVKDSGTPESICTTYIYISEPTAIKLELTSTDITCFGANDGEIIVEVSGGQGPYEFTWSDDKDKTSQVRTNLTAGEYSVTVKDVLGQEKTDKIKIEDAEEITYDLTPSNGNCPANSPASVTVNNINGGKLPYTVKLIGGTDNINKTEEVNTYNGSVIFTNLPDGNGSEFYTIVITDYNGCEVSKDFEIFNPNTPLSVTLTDNFSTYATNNVEPKINISISGGVYVNDITKQKYGYWLQKQKFVNNVWVNDGEAYSLGTSTQVEYTVPPATIPQTKYRVIVYDKNNELGRCSATSTETPII